jgi:hypothetical protein
MLDEQMTSPEIPATPEAGTVEKLFTDEQFAHLGGGTLAYVKTMLSDDVKRIFPKAPDIASGIRIFALLGADGTPLILSDSREMAVANAMQSNLEMVSLH